MVPEVVKVEGLQEAEVAQDEVVTRGVDVVGVDGVTNSSSHICTRMSMEFMIEWIGYEQSYIKKLCMLLVTMFYKKLLQSLLPELCTIDFKSN